MSELARGSLALLFAVAIAFVVAVPPQAEADEPRLILGTTVGLAESGLLDALLSAFERQIGRPVTVVAVSAPQALALGARGEVDALLIDAAEDVAGYVSAGHAVDRRLVMHADDVMLGPPDDPAQARAVAGIQEALRRVAGTNSGWVSRADNSGLYQREKRLWREAGVDPTGQPWYLPLGQGMSPTLAATTERQSYTLAERLAYLQQRDALDLVVVVEGDSDLLRLFHLLVINPGKGDWIDEAGARALADFLVGADAQAQIRDFGVERFGQPVFVPDAGRTEQELQPSSGPAA